MSPPPPAFSQHLRAVGSNAPQQPVKMAAPVKSYEQLLAEEKVRELKKALREAKKAAAALAVDPAVLAPAPAGPAAPAAPRTEELPFLSLINVELWKKNWHKCFDRAVETEADVRAGDSGSIGIGYGVSSSLTGLIEGKTEEEAIAALAAAGAISSSGATLTARGIRDTILFFHNLSKSADGTLFGIKKGTKAMWVAEKTSGYFHAPPAERAAGPLVSEWQHETNFFEHRFGFRIVAVVREDEQKMVHHVQLVKKHTVTF